MLRFLLGTDAPWIADVESFPNCRGSDRKFRLFACSCYYRLAPLLPDTLACATVEIAERFADGLATGEELGEAHARLREVIDALEGPWGRSRGDERRKLYPKYAAVALALQVTRPEAQKAAYYAAANAYVDLAAIVNPGVASSDRAFLATQRKEERAQADLLRCIFGPIPFGRQAEPSWRTPVVLSLARPIYDDRDFADLPILADALEESQCDDAELLGHLRGPGPHARGCFALDQLLAKE
jgi:hypothetical protein